MDINLSRQEALDLLDKYIKEDSLKKHCLAVEATMRHFAEILAEDVEKWGLIGLLHDIDYELYPDQHCKKTYDILRSENIPEEYIDSMVSHGYGILPYVEVQPEHIMEKILFTVDSLTGLITASVLVRPSRSILDLKPKSVNKKWKDKSFAKNVDRNILEKGLEMLQMERSYLIGESIEGMKKEAQALDLIGEIG